jgi:xanthine dehydrogenase accessory factor
VRRAILDQLRGAREAGRAVALVTPLGGGEPYLGDAAAGDGEVAAAIARALRTGEAEVVGAGDGAMFVEPHLPPLRLVVVGAVHVAAPLAEMATLAGFAVTIVDPRRAWATEARFPGRRLIAQWPDDALRELALDTRTAVVT